MKARTVLILIGALGLSTRASAAPYVAAGATWTYLDNATEPGTDWTLPAYNDGTWPEGAAQFGFGDGDETTVLNAGIVTAYFRHAFTVTGADLVPSLRLRVLRDDGAAVYLNGVEIFRSNLPPGPLTYNTLALTTVSGAEETTEFVTADLNARLLVEGRNVLAVEVHQASAASSDLSFDLELLRSDLPPPPDLPVIRIDALDATAAEPGNDTGLVRISRTGPTNEALQISINISGNANNGADCVLLPGTVLIPAGIAAVDLLVEPLDDNLVEGPETLVFALVQPPCANHIPPDPGCYRVGAPDQASVNILDDDAQPPPPPPPPPPGTGAPDDQVNPAIASDGDGYLVVWADKRNTAGEYDIYGARVSASGEVLDPEGIAICTAPESQWYPAVAFDGANYLVVWSDGRANNLPDPSLELYAARVTPEGAVLDPDGFPVTHGEVVYQPTVAFNGTECLVAGYAWNHNGHRGSTLLGVRVTPTAEIRDMEELVIHESIGGDYPAIASRLGEDWLVVWNQGADGIAGSRVSRLGEISAPQDLVANGETWVHGLAAVGSDCFLTSTARRSIGTDTYVLDVFGTWIGQEGRARNTLLVAANTNQTVGSHLQPTTYYQDHPSPAFNGSEIVVVWEAGAIYTNGGNYMFLSDIRAARVGLDGSVAPVISLCSAPQDQSAPALAANGSDFMAVWHDARTAPPQDYSPSGQFDIYGGRVRADGEAVDGDGFIVSGVTAPDEDQDGVPDDVDACPQTSLGSVVDGQGCSLDQLCPCNAPWANHGEYVDCVIEHAWAFYRDGLITIEERRRVTQEAVQSDCGRQPLEIEPMQLHLLPLTPQECQREGVQFVVSSSDILSSCIVETSTNLKDWTLVRTVAPSDLGGEVICPRGDEPARFFRIRRTAP
ncbi:MAG TPA: hypothetical protein VNU68_24170 [Verrucomicrobiae bacterium]|nr:hypothetical protein [Verrucomicrobiae bacterium]